jgi:hypothetical protein
MLFMPTARSGSKQHLLPTQANRIQILNQYCRKLQDTFAWHTFYQITKPYVITSCESKNFNTNIESTGFIGGCCITCRRRT